MNEKYAHIINLPRHISPTRQQMSVSDRAAQFAPYSALSGYEEVVKESADELECIFIYGILQHQLDTSLARQKSSLCVKSIVKSV